MTKTADLESTKHYDWAKTFSYQHGTRGEICLVIGAKGIGKTFGLRVQCIKDFIRKGRLFCEICRSEEEARLVQNGYFDKIQQEGFFADYRFRVKNRQFQIAPIDSFEYDESGEPKENTGAWSLLGYIVSLGSFQREKKRTYKWVSRFIFDEAVIDSKDKRHRYLSSEYLILANLLDTISREQPDTKEHYRVYLLGNACNLNCPYFEYLGIRNLPEYGYRYYNDKHVIMHYVEPWDAELRKEKTLVGRMLKGLDESEMVFENRFESTDYAIAKKTPNATYLYALCYDSKVFAIWADYSKGLFYVTHKLPKDAENIYTLTKKDATLDYTAIRKTSGYAKMLVKLYYLNALRYENIATREQFFMLLEYLGLN